MKNFSGLIRFCLVGPRSLGCGVAALLFLSPPALTCGQNQAPKTLIPEIARIGKVQIGYSTQEELAKKWGEGKTLIGGHPNSGRVWRIAGTNWFVQTDGFDYSERGLVVDQLSLSTKADLGADIPPARLSKRDFLWLGAIAPGMSQAKVLEILKRRAPRSTSIKGGYGVRAKGFSPLTNIRTPLRNWEATLTFADGLLIRLDLSARTEP